MRKFKLKFTLIVSVFIFVLTAIFLVQNLAYAQTIKVSPDSVIQGDPIMVTIENSGSSSPIVNFDNKKYPTFIFGGMTRALIPIDINKKPGDYDLSVAWSDGKTINKNISVGLRKKIEQPLGIPAKLGGNTKQAQDKLVTNLSTENATLLGIKTGAKQFWSKPFIFPVTNPIVTDLYGYNRETGQYTIPHKGTDFRAKVGTPIFAMNRGVVRVVHNYTIYGKTIIVDHGLGLQTFYMHLSKSFVNEGELVQQGQIIGLSGNTGYEQGPHLHLTVRINGISIDPMKFMDFFATSSMMTINY